ncbi:unnamed protein product [Paramecium sonneborni]|uniref:OTU domain-containing protein n=1 Tax=Paramecium sonneborni TaxID=65129 RepID=A0A8S1QK81_9CILI|nr:unnamed protein product [Paramecium sonneborni]
MFALSIIVILFQYSSQYQDTTQLTLENRVDQPQIEQTSNTNIINDSEDDVKQELSQSKNKFLNGEQNVNNLIHIQFDRIYDEIQKFLSYFMNKRELVIGALFILLVGCFIKNLYKKGNVKKEVIQNNESLKLINDLYDQSWRKRVIEPQFLPFVREQENEQSFRKEYCQRQINFEECNSFIPVRGDGNCFYTAFGYQFLKILITVYDDQQFQTFVEKAKKKIKFMINYENFQIDEEQGQILSKDFFSRIINLRNSDDKNKLFDYYKNYEYINNENDGIFYGLATIFFRNLANYALEFNELKECVQDRNNLLIWELECNSNEIVIDSLSQCLKLQIQILLSQNQEIIIQCYGQEYKDKIMLLLKPGHYNIGLKL